MSRKSFLKPFAATVGTLLASTQANAAIAPQVTEAVARFEQVTSTTGLADLTVVNAGASETAAQFQHDSHSSHSSHASHSSHSSSAY